MSNEIKKLAKRASAAFVALSLGLSLTLVSLLSPVIAEVHASAAGGQVQSRSIKISTSTPGATNQSYDVTFTAGSASTVKGIIVDFCSGSGSSVGSPIIGDTNCPAPTGFATGTPTITNDPDTVTNNASVSGWTVGTLNSGRTVELSNATGVATTAGTSIFNFAINGLTNPTDVGTFYARVVTYTTTAAAGTYAAGSEGSYQDYGGFALSTTNNINITAKVEESLSFCVVSADPNVSGSSCGTAGFVSSNLPNLTIGHGSPVATIDNTAIDTASAYMQISTNATNGAVVRMKATNACANAGLSTNGGAACSISGLDNTAAADLIPSNTLPYTGAAGKFGLFVGTGYDTTAIGTTSGSFVADANYNDGVNVTTTGTPPGLTYGMDNSNTTGVLSPYGDVLGTTGGAPCNTINSQLVFAAIAALTTPAGIYTGGESLIATGTF